MNARPEATTRVLRPSPRRFSAREIFVEDVRQEARSLRGAGPPGDLAIDLRRSLDMNSGQLLGILLDLHRRHGPVFQTRMLHHRMTFLVGAPATAYALLEHPEQFHWREGHFGQLAPLLGDGLITTDAAYHDRARRLIMPAFHRGQIDAAVAIMAAEADARCAAWSPGETVDVYRWTRETSLRIALRVFLGIDPGDHDGGAAIAVHFERALQFYGIDLYSRLLRGPGTPWAHMRAARNHLDAFVYAVISQRREDGVAGRSDILSGLLRASAESPDGLSDEEIRDQLVTLLFAGHYTSSSTVAFVLHELARRPDLRDRLRKEQEHVLQGELPTAEHVDGKALGELERVIDETLRRYPPVFIGARRAMSDIEVEVEGVPIRRGSYVHVAYWATHHLEELFPDPHAFHPDRWTPEMRAALPRGAYTPFGGGSRICVGKRFGLTAVRTILTSLLRRHDISALGGLDLHLQLEPTLSPRNGLPVCVTPR
jgi:cytochrome P450